MKQVGNDLFFYKMYWLTISIIYILYKRFINNLLYDKY